MAVHVPTRRIERALHLSTLEGMFFGAMQGAGEHFTSAYAIALGASNSQLAALVSLPQLLGALSQAVAARLSTYIRRRKRWLVLFALLQDFTWLPILFLGFAGLGDGYAVYWLIGVLCAYTAFNSIAAVVWSGIMAEAVPDRIRGRYFGGRSRWVTVAHMASFWGAGTLLFALREHGLAGFGIVFGLAFLFRAVSAGLFTTLLELPQESRHNHSLGLWPFARQLFTTNLGRATLYVFCLSFTTNLASPYFTPFMLRDLNLSYMAFTLLELATVFASILAVTHWGAAADKAGNQKIMRICGILVAVVPLLWLVSRNVLWLGFAQFYSGVVWAGFNLVSVNYIYDATTPENRLAYLGYYSAGVGVAVALGALAGSLLLRFLPPIMGSAILSLFLVSGLLRFLTGLAFLPFIREVRRVRTIGAAELFHILLGGSAVHRPAHLGRLHVHLRLHGHRDE
ncbi:MAG: MFS transporter [Chloroflexi bacterium]|nr:MFS transporter [Chloroflexota bacterium]